MNYRKIFLLVAVLVFFAVCMVGAYLLCNSLTRAKRAQDQAVSPSAEVVKKASGGGTPPPRTTGGGTPPPRTTGGGTPPPRTTGGGTPPPPAQPVQEK